MKTITIFLAITIFASVSFGQNALKMIKSQVGNTDILKTWDLNEVMQSYSSEITKIEGKDPYHRTNILYKTFNQVFDDVNSVVALDGLSEEERSEAVNIYQGIAAGGQIALFLDRATPEQADLENFSITITDLAESNIIYSETLESSPGRYYSLDIWYNYVTVEIPNQVEGPFMVTIMDSANNTLYKYVITGKDEHLNASMLTKK